MILYKDLSWWYWAVITGLLITGLAGLPKAFYLAVLLSAVQIAHYRLRQGSFRAFPVQVRTVYFAILLLALWEPMRSLYWLPVVGTSAVVLFGYCMLARCLSLLPWNRGQSLSWSLVLRTFFSPPVRGNILQGLPPAS